MLRFVKRNFAGYLASDAGRSLVGKSKSFDPIRQVTSTSAEALEVDERKKTTAIRRHAEPMYPAEDKRDDQTTTPEKSVDLKQKDDETSLRPSLQQGINNSMHEMRDMNKDMQKINKNIKDQVKQRSMEQIVKTLKAKTSFTKIRALPEIEARFQAERNKHYTHLAKVRGISLEEYFEKLNQKSREISKDKEICTRIDGEILKQILKETDPNKRRFMSQFETGTSNGLLDLDFYKRRIVERNTLGNYDLEMKDNSNRIIYGYLAKPDQVRGLYDEQGKCYHLDKYGDVVIIFEKTEELKRRTSFTVGDSLDYTGSVRGVPYEKPNGECFAWGRPRLCLDENYPLKGFDPLNIEEFDALPVYVEAQIHYGVSLKHVARVVLTGKSAQDQELIDLLKENKISVKRDLPKL